MQNNPLSNTRAFEILREHEGNIHSGEMARIGIMIHDLGALPVHSLRHLLDAGSGRGLISFFLLHALPDLQATLVDTKDNYEFGRKIFFPDSPPQDRFEFQHLNLGKWKTPARYDLVLCMDVIEHIVDWQPVIRELWQCLAPGGYLYLQTPGNYPSPTYPTHKVFCANLKQRLSRFLPRLVRFDGTYHVRHGFSCKTLKDFSESLEANIVFAGENYFPNSWFPYCPFKPHTRLLLQRPRS